MKQENWARQEEYEWITKKETKKTKNIRKQLLENLLNEASKHKFCFN